MTKFRLNPLTNGHARLLTLSAIVGLTLFSFSGSTEARQTKDPTKERNIIRFACIPTVSGNPNPLYFESSCKVCSQTQDQKKCMDAIVDARKDARATQRNMNVPNNPSAGGPGHSSGATPGPSTSSSSGSSSGSTSGSTSGSSSGTDAPVGQTHQPPPTNGSSSGSPSGSTSGSSSGTDVPNGEQHQEPPTSGGEPESGSSGGGEEEYPETPLPQNPLPPHPEQRTSYSICKGPVAQSLLNCSDYSGISSAFPNFHAQGGKGGWRFPYKNKDGHDVPPENIIITWEPNSEAEVHFCFCQAGTCDDNGCSLPGDGSGDPLTDCPNPVVSTTYKCDEPSPDEVAIACGVWQEGVDNRPAIEGASARLTGGYCTSLSDTCDFLITCPNGGNGQHVEPCTN